MSRRRKHNCPALVRARACIGCSGGHAVSDLGWLVLVKSPCDLPEVRNVRCMSEESPYRRWWKSLDEDRRAMAVDVWRNGDFKALHELMPPENQHGGSDTWVDFAKVTRENEPRDDDISWVITD